MKAIIRRLLSRRALPNPTGHIINIWEHKSWGDNLFWSDCPGKNGNIDRWRLGSHALRLPIIGDEIRGNMQSGRIGRWMVTKVDYMHGVSDGFFADCIPLAPFYLDELPAS